MAAQTNPVYQGYLVFAAHSGSSASYVMQGPFAGFGREAGQNTNQMHNDANAAYQNAVMWAVTGNAAHATKAMQILNGWSSTMTAVLGTEPVLSSMDGYKLVNAAEILRYTGSGWAAADIARCERWFKEVWYPSFNNFAYYANGNWDNSAIKTMMAIGVFCNDRPMFERAVRYYLNGAGNGRLTHYLVNDDGQTQESGRDQSHTMLGLGLLAEAAQISWNQGLDLYSAANNRLLKGFEYTANYNLGNTVPFTPALDRSGKYGAGGSVNNYSIISTVDRGEYHPVFEMVWNHYLYRAGLPASASAFTKQFADSARPEGAATSADHPGFGTFLFSFTGPVTRPAPTAPPLTPAGLSAYANAGNALSWAASLDTTSYAVKRATTRGGPYTTIASGVTTSTYTDTSTSPGQLHFYTVSAFNDIGESPNAQEVSISAGLPTPWASTDIGSVAVAGRTDFDGQAFKLEGAGTNIGGTSDQLHFAYVPMTGDGTLVARVTLPLSSQRSKVGLMMRETLAADSAHVSLLLPVTSTATWVLRSAAGAVTTAGATVTIPAPYAINNHLDLPYWVKMSRVGDVFTGWVSTDGVAWTQIDSSTMPLASSLYVGLPACSRLTSVTTTATFDNVTVPGFSVPAPAAPDSFSASLATTQISLAWTPSDGASTYTVKRSVNSGGSYTTIATGLTAPNLLITDQTGSAPRTYVVSATNISGESANSSEVTIAIPVPIITSATSATTLSGSPFFYTIVAANFPASFGASGLPTGLAINPTNGVISGIPTAIGTSTVTLSATNIAGTATATLALNVNPAPPPVITSATSASGTQGDSFSYAITATNSPTSFFATGLPSGLTINTSTGLITGTPLGTGSSTVTLGATNLGGTGSASLALSFSATAPSINGTWSNTAGTTTSAIASTGGSANLTWTGQTFVIGDIVRLTGTVPGGFTANTAYWVVAQSGATFQLATTRTGSAITATTTIANGTAQRYQSWQSSANWTGGAIASGFGASATINSFTSSVPAISLDANVRLGSLLYNTGTTDLTLVNGKLGGTLTFTTPAGSPSINLGTTGGRKLVLSNNNTYPLSLAGTQGLQLTSAPYTSTAGYPAFRLLAGMDWSGFSGGLTLTQGVIEFRNTTGSDTAANNLLPAQRLTLGTGAPAATLLYSSRFSTQTLGALDGNASGYVLAVSTVGGALVIGADNQNGAYAGSFAISPFTPNAVDTGRILLTKNGTGSQLLSGVIGNGVTGANNSTLTVNAGKLTLSAANLYLGVTNVNGGTLLVNGSIVSAATCNAGTFGGSGFSSAAVTIGTGSGSGATLAPGNDLVGTFTTTSAITLRSDATLAAEFNPTALLADKVVANGVTLNNPALATSVFGTLATMPGGTTFTLIDNTSAAPVAGTFNGLTEGAALTVGMNSCVISYIGGTGNDVVLTVQGNVMPPSINSSASTTGTFGVPFNYAIPSTGSPTSFTATGLPAGLTLNPSTGIISGMPIAAGNYTVPLTATNAGGHVTGTLTLTIAKAPATIVLSNLATTYDGSAKAATATSYPAGLLTSLTYSGSSTPPTAGGSYTVVATIDDANYEGTATGTLNVVRAPASIALSNLAQTHDGSPKTVGSTTTPSGLVLQITYNGSTTAPIEAGSYAVVATTVSDNYHGLASATLVIAKTPATITLGALTHTYDGATKAASATTNPTGLAVNLTYDSSATAPSAVGSYAVAATVIEANYTGSATGTLVIGKASATVTLGALTHTYDGTPKLATATTTPAGLAVTFTYDGLPVAIDAPSGTLTSYASAIGQTFYVNVTGATSGAIYGTNSSGYANTSDVATAAVHAGIVTPGQTAVLQISLLADAGAYASSTENGVTSLAAPASGGAFQIVGLASSGFTTGPVAAGNYSVTATISDASYTGSASGTLTIAKAIPILTWTSPASIAYGTPLGATQLNASASTAGTFTYTPAAGTILNAGVNQTLSATFAPTDTTNFTTATATTAITVTPATATITLGALSQIYNGTARVVTVTTSPTGLSVSLTYNGSATTPTEAGTYAIVATITDVNYTGSASGTLTIARAPVAITLIGLTATYDGAAKPATATTSPAGLPVTITYSGSATAPSNAGTYSVAASVNTSNYVGVATGTLTIAKATATVTLAPLTQLYDGTPRAVTATTVPTGLTVDLLYDSLANAPVYPGTFAVSGVVNNSNYQGSTTATLNVATTVLVRHAPTINAMVDGSVQLLLPESLALNTNSTISSDLLVPGTPTVQLNGNATYGGTTNATGSVTPSNYTITLNSGSVLRHVVRRVDARAMPAVVAPPIPSGSRTVSINTASDTPGDFTTLRHLTLNAAVNVTVPPGTYGNFVANSGGSSFTLGIAGATQPAVYNLQSLVFNSSTSSLRVVGPVILTVNNTVVLNGATAGDIVSLAWLDLHVATGGVTLNGASRFHGSVTAPNGTINVNGSSTLTGRVISDRLNVSGTAHLSDPAAAPVTPQSPPPGNSPLPASASLPRAANGGGAHSSFFMLVFSLLAGIRATAIVR